MASDGSYNLEAHYATLCPSTPFLPANYVDSQDHIVGETTLNKGPAEGFLNIHLGEAGTSSFTPKEQQGEQYEQYEDLDEEIDEKLDKDANEEEADEEVVDEEVVDEEVVDEEVVDEGIATSQRLI